MRTHYIGGVDGDELEVLLLGDVAHPPDCLVEARCGQFGQGRAGWKGHD